MNETRDLIIGIDFGKNIRRSAIMTERLKKPVLFL